MIQRIQTVYLAISALLLGLIFAFNFATYHTETGNYIFSVNGISPKGSNANVILPYAIVIPIIIAIIVFAILQYKKRKVQIKIVRLAYLLILITLALLFFDLSNIEKALKINQENASYGAGIFLLAASWPLVFLANRAIKKDEELVKSVERLR